MPTFFNTLGRRQEPLETLRPGKVALYTCGPTVYDHAHIGNLRTFVFEDILRRSLRHLGYEVDQVMNITDVDDKTIENSLKAGVTLQEYTKNYTDLFFEDLDALGIERAEHYPRATEHIPEMLALIRSLKERGHLYESRGSLYFRIDSFPQYGRLARLDGTGSQGHERIDSDEYDKDDPRDFAVWKAHKEGEPFWDSEFGRGRPGWHLECSAMSMKYLGDVIDIHTGGVDNIFPHHDNEIAQSEASTGKPFVRYWLHAAHLQVEGEKMSKSLGNCHTLRNIRDKGFGPRALRYLLTSAHYRTSLNFTMEGLKQSETALARLDDLACRLRDHLAVAESDTGLAEKVRAARSGMLESLDDDLNTSGALGHLFVLVRELNSALDAGRAGRDDVTAARDVLSTFETIFGICLGRTEVLDSEVEAMIRKRTEARARKDFIEADRIRDQLLCRGVVLEDTSQGVRWKRRGG
ncbi:MAG: cysteine--tRNA ligase [Acidobacteria bacterium]|nr:cysteine--tRNA ligase [Acidobacteriota bacterium]